MTCLSLFFFLGVVAGQAKPFVENPEEGWLWYKEGKEEKAPKIEEKPKLDVSQEKKPLTANDRVLEIRKEFEEVLATALLQPTIQNVTQAKRKQAELEQRAEEFSNMWVLAHLLDAKGASHQGNAHPWYQEISQKEQERNLTKKLHQLSQTYGLFFAFKQSCPYCHRFAPVIAQFAQTYGFEVKGISADGGKIEGIPNVSKDNGALAVINPEGIYPALFLANPKTMEVIPIAWGMVTNEQLLNNFATILPQLEGS